MPLHDLSVAEHPPNTEDGRERHAPHATVPRGCAALLLLCWASLDCSRPTSTRPPAPEPHLRAGSSRWSPRPPSCRGRQDRWGTRGAVAAARRARPQPNPAAARLEHWSPSALAAWQRGSPPSVVFCMVAWMWRSAGGAGGAPARREAPASGAGVAAALASGCAGGCGGGPPAAGPRAPRHQRRGCHGALQGRAGAQEAPEGL